MTATFALGSHRIGGGPPCFVIAEAGVNHNGDVAMARDLVDAAAAAGADAVKFQAFEPALVASPAAVTAPYQKAAESPGTQEALLRSLVLPPEAWLELAARARAAGMNFLCTAFDGLSLAAVEAAGVSAHKVASGEIDNLPYIRELGRRGLPLLISTGMATIDEVGAALDAASEAPGVCLLHCVTAYPAPVSSANLRAMVAMAERFRVPVGWSDHTVGLSTALAAVALGASVLEKHLTLDRRLPGPDHRASAEPSDLAAYVAGVREVEAALGDGNKRPQPEEAVNLDLVRRSYHAARRIPSGHLIAEEDVVLLRPRTGMVPGDTVVGRTTRRSLEPGDPVTSDALEPSG